MARSLRRAGYYVSKDAYACREAIRLMADDPTPEDVAADYRAIIAEQEER